MASWVLTKQLQAFRDQMDAAFPNRDRRSDGTIGDTIHQAEKSGHNPDRTANAEYKDGDAKNEVRALDIDSDTGDPDVSMEDVVQHLLRLARAGKLTMIRYMIFNRRIWSASTGWAQQPYTGASPHTEHLHLSGAYTQASDEDAGANYHLEDLVAPTVEDISAALLALLRSEDGKRAVGQAVLGYDPGYRDGKPENGIWPGISDATYPKTPDSNGTVGLGTAVTSLLARLGQVDEQVAARLVGDTPQETAAALKTVLGDQAAEVGRILAASA